MFLDHSLCYQNVVSKYYRFPPEYIESAFIDLRDIIIENGYEPKGDMFFSILNDPRKDDIMLAELFLTIEENDAVFNEEDEISFRSYFHVDSMLMTRVMENFEQQSQIKYWELIDYVKVNRFKAMTPIFVQLKMNYQGKNYIELSMGYKQEHLILYR